MAFVFAFRLFPETPKHLSGRFDIAGAALIALGVTPLLFAINEGPRMGVDVAGGGGGVRLGPIALWGFVRVERAAEAAAAAAVPARAGLHLRHRHQAVLNAAYMGSFILTPLLLQNVLDFSETKTGLVSIARPLAFSPSPGRWRFVLRLGARAPRIGRCRRWWQRCADGDAGQPVPPCRWSWLAGPGRRGHGVGHAAVVGQRHGVGRRGTDLGIAGAAQQMMIQVGVVFGITLMQSVQQTRLAAVGLQASYHWGYAAGVVLAGVAVFTATRIASATGSTRWRREHRAAARHLRPAGWRAGRSRTGGAQDDQRRRLAGAATSRPPR